MNTTLAKIESSVPIKAVPNIDDILKTEFKYFISKLLTMKPNNEEALEDALPAVREHCWSMGMKEVLNMFKMYADGKLNIEPKSNYFDRVLVGQIFKAYNQYKKSKVVPSKYDKETEDIIEVIKWFDWFIQERKITKEATWIYDFLDAKELFDFTKKEKQLLMFMGKEQGLNKQDSEDKAKRTLLRRYFERLEAKSEHIKDVL